MEELQPQPPLGHGEQGGVCITHDSMSEKVMENQLLVKREC